MRGIIKNVNINPSRIGIISILKKMGAKILLRKNSIIIYGSKNFKKIDISTKPYPGFPTDMQAQLMVLMTQAKGLSKIKEN